MCAAVICIMAVNSYFNSALAHRADEALWIPVSQYQCIVSFGEKEPIAVKDPIVAKAASILCGNAPDPYFKEICLRVTKDKKANPESYVIKTDSLNHKLYVTAPSSRGVLYGALSLYRPGACRDRSDAPVHPIRVLNHWDNLDGTVERGYAGRSIWHWDESLTSERVALYEKYALANAMAGINGTVLNNVNASPKILGSDNLKNIAEVADLLRPYGIKVYLSVNFASPMALGGYTISALNI